MEKTGKQQVSNFNGCRKNYDVLDWDRNGNEHRHDASITIQQVKNTMEQCVGGQAQTPLHRHGQKPPVSESKKPIIPAPTRDTRDKLYKAPGASLGLHGAANEINPQHRQQKIKGITMEKSVGKKLPDPAMPDGIRWESAP